MNIGGPKTILDIIGREQCPAPWSEGENIPWNDPEFSERMLAEHLSQEHDLASRRSENIEQHVEWIFSEVMGSRPARVLDLACGPGLYSIALARNGCECVGIDFSPASIRHAREIAGSGSSHACSFHHADVRDARFGEDFDLVMMIYGQINVFRRDQGLEILKKAHSALKSGGVLLLEVQTREQIQNEGESEPTWYSAESGLFSPDPHLVLQENFWDSDAGASTSRFSVIEAANCSVSTYALSNEAYTVREFEDTLDSVGFTNIEMFPSLNGTAVDEAHDLPVYIARK